MPAAADKNNSESKDALCSVSCDERGRGVGKVRSVFFDSVCTLARPLLIYFVSSVKAVTLKGYA